MTQLSRRAMLALLAAAASASTAPPVFAEGLADRKLIFVILRGAMDGLSALIPDDRETEALRGALLAPVGERLDLASGFRLHPALSGLKGLYDSGDAAFIHAAASAYRDRSHFDGQDRLETLGPPGTPDGWLNRALVAGGLRGLAIGYAVPLALRGPGSATNWSPPVFSSAPAGTLDRLARLYEADARLAATLAQSQSMPMEGADMGRARGGPAAEFVEALSAMGQLMAAEGAPGVGMVSLDGWDMHANLPSQMQLRLQGLDSGLAALKAALGPAWARTVVVACSEFGRTAAANGTRGSDHGTGGLVILAGGAVRGGRVLGDWPGLSQRALYDGRDLAPANSVEAILKGLLRDHMGLDRSALDQRVFPASPAAIDGLIA